MDRLEEIKAKIKDSIGPLSGGFVAGARPLNDEYSDDWLYSFGRYKAGQAALETVNKFNTSSELDEWLPFVRTIYTLKSKALEQVPQSPTVNQAFELPILKGSVDFLKKLLRILGEGASDNGE